jgi:hypothetical protein
MELLLRYFHTIKYLKIGQIKYQLYYRLRTKMRSHFYFRPKIAIAKDGYPLEFVPWIDKANSFNDYSFIFINLSRRFKSPEIDWNYAEYGKLWVYNLNYFDFLLQPQMDAEIGWTIIDDFISKQNIDSTGMEPYPIALRGINWIKYISKDTSSSILTPLRLSTFSSSLYAQYKILFDNLEYHLLGNHLLEDGFSLLFGAFYFKDKKFYYKSKEIIEGQLNEQILCDGGHFELSPMYHQLILDRLLDCINLIQYNNRFDKQHGLLELLQEKANLMLKWLDRMTFSNGKIPMLNDSTDGIAPTTKQLNHYSRLLNINPIIHKLELGDSGYRRYNGSNYECIVDAGHVGPDYQPGHAHADTFNFVINIKNEAFIVDTGISTYNKDSFRKSERSTQSHNTVVVNGKNSSDVWSGFRVGRRAHTKILSEREDAISANHDGYKSTGIIHERNWKFEKCKIVISDVLTKKSEYCYALLHFDYKIVAELNNSIIRTKNCLIRFDGAEEVIMNEFQQALEFNKHKISTRVEIKFTDHLKTIIEITN